MQAFIIADESTVQCLKTFGLRSFFPIIDSVILGNAISSFLKLEIV